MTSTSLTPAESIARLASTDTLAASILAADFSRLGDAVRAADQAGVGVIHIDVMDGHFVSNLTFGALAVEACRKVTDLLLDVHLMMDNPDAFLDVMVGAGASSITVHAEACTHLHRTLQRIRELGVGVGLAVNPLTPLAVMHDALPYLDMALVMTVNPGFGGQSLIPASLERIATVRRWISEQDLTCNIQVDGGINADTLSKVQQAGANVFVAGSAIFGEDGADASEIEGNVRVLQELLGV
ncbi:MAG: ribulose-phosphate 3-epimerase [Deinococcota bacterium]